VPDPVLTANDISIGYVHGRHRTEVIAEHLSVSLFPGELVCLVGPNGSGKSTLLRTLAGIQKALSGEIRIMDAEIGAQGPRSVARFLAVVLTEPVNAGLMTAEAIVSLGRYPHTGWSGRLSSKDRGAVHWAMETVGATALAHRRCSDLSDGERQRVMIARALAQEPQIMIMDEITAFLDLPRRVEIMGLLRNVTRDHGKAAILSTHELDLALRIADRIWLLEPGGTLHVGAPEDLVLSGVFERTFRGRGLTFDSRRGSFQFQSPHRCAIRVTGEGPYAFWTAHALEREGFGPGPDSLEPVAHVEVNECHWRTHVNGEIHEHASVYDLLCFLRAKFQ
jgi:iron complex transport system ATP-binding protein